MALLEKSGNARGLLPALSAYMGHVKWVYAERYLALTPERFYDQLSRLGSVEETSLAKTTDARATVKKRTMRVARKGGREDAYATFGEIPPRIRW
jgi:hypothetical protein